MFQAAVRDELKRTKGDVAAAKALYESCSHCESKFWYNLSGSSFHMAIFLTSFKLLALVQFRF